MEPGDGPAERAGQRAQATVHVRLRGPLDDDGQHGLRLELSRCLREGVQDVRVHVEPDVDVPRGVLASLQAAADHLAARGGRLLLVGCTERLARSLRIHGLGRLGGPAVVDPYPAEPAPAQALVSR